MQWYNSITGDCQSNDPGQGCFGELLIERRLNWEQKDDGFRPPAPVPTKEQLNAPILAQITALEQKQLRPLREFALGDADALPRIQTIDTEIATLRAQLQ